MPTYRPKSQISRSAFVIGIRAAMREGSKPPSSPRNAAKISADIKRSGVILKLNATSLKVRKFIVPVAIPFTGRASKQPTTPPINEMIIDSMTKLDMMLAFENPNARSVPISRVR